jgi:hypothetical protein
MRVRLFSMVMIFAILFGGLTAPETAHAGDLLTGHGIEVLEAHDHVDADDQKNQQQNGSSPCHALVHHHCGVALAADPASSYLAIGTGKAVVMSLIVQPMRSLALAPPTEPPAA